MDQLAEITRDEITNIFGLAWSESEKIAFGAVLTRWHNVFYSIST